MDLLTRADLTWLSRRDVQRMQQVQVEAVDALRTAAAQQQDARLDEMEIDTSTAGTPVWEVEFKRADGSEVKVEVDAATGQIVG